MSKVMWLGVTAATVQVAMGLWLAHEAQAASDGDLVQCHEPLVAKALGRSPLHPRAAD
jgi:hypothetical protein